MSWRSKKGIFWKASQKLKSKAPIIWKQEDEMCFRGKYGYKIVLEGHSDSLCRFQTSWCKSAYLGSTEECLLLAQEKGTGRDAGPRFSLGDEMNECLSPYQMGKRSRF